MNSTNARKPTIAATGPSFAARVIGAPSGWGWIHPSGSDDPIRTPLPVPLPPHSGSDVMSARWKRSPRSRLSIVTDSSTPWIAARCAAVIASGANR